MRKRELKEEKLSEPGFEGWLVEDTHSKMRDHNEQKRNKLRETGKLATCTKNQKKAVVLGAWK